MTTDTAPLPRTAYTPREVAKSLGMPYKRVLRMIHTGRMRAICTGQHYTIPVEAVAEFRASASASAP